MSAEPPPTPPPSPPPPTLVQPTPRASAPRRRLWWHRLILGLWYRPVDVLDEARDRGAWSAALMLCLVSGGIGALSVDAIRQQWSADRTMALQLAGLAEAGVLAASFVLGAVTHAIARTLGGTGRFAPTASLFIVLFWVAGLPRLAIAAWLPTGATIVQAATWTTWGFGYVLAVLLIRGQHHLSTRKSVAAVSVQMLTALALIKVGPVR
ncbi:Yip1 family protein [Streptomyces halobius]|uniref:YIP1 family protein n=1 Tax=Streptomyces halobius TaxID=2879846 RepID=A0ABY4MAR3_9ACTN|nr:Yip1 family protein [Streptomyces halobius]UQA94866.1 YIP1 family protein [Streptomyces halobius]